MSIFAYKKINDSLKKLKHFFESLMGKKKKKSLSMMNVPFSSDKTY